MKKLLLLLLVFPLVFAACSDDDDKDDEGKKPVPTFEGTWEFGKAEITVDTSNDADDVVKKAITEKVAATAKTVRAEFDATKGEYTLYAVDEDGPTVKFEEGTYTLDGREITLSKDETHASVYEYTLTPTTLKLTKDETSFYQGVYEKEGEELTVDKVVLVQNATKKK